MVRVADYIAAFLEKVGIQDIFMLTGNGAMYLNDAIAQSGLNFYCARNEAAAPMMAEAYARLKGSMGAVCVTSGPGSTNAVPGLAEAWVDGAPVMILSGQVQRNHTTRNADVPGLRTFGTAEIDIVPIVESLTKYVAMVNEPESIRYHLEKAAHLATTGRPGPVWLDIPMDIQYCLVDPETLDGYTPPVDEFTFPSEDEGVESLISLLAGAVRPLLIVGHGVRQSDSSGELLQLMETAGIPTLFSRLGYDLVPYSHPLNFGLAGLKGTRYCASILKSADVVVSLGCRLAIQLVGHQFDCFAPDARVAMVDIDEAELKKPGIKIDLPIHRDLKGFLERLLAQLPADLPDWSDWQGQCRSLKEQHPIISSSMQKDPIDLYLFMSRLDALSDKHHVFVTDAGSNYYVGGQTYQYEKGQREITSAAFASMGLSIPLAIGASIADRTAQILAVTGDGSLELNIQELKTISHYNLNIKLFVINNGGYVSMRNWQDGFFEGRRIDSEDTTGAGTLDLESIAHAFGLNYAVIEKFDEIDTTIRRVMNDDRPIFVEVVCDPNQKIVEPIKDLSFEVTRP